MLCRRLHRRPALIALCLIGILSIAACTVAPGPGGTGGVPGSATSTPAILPSPSPIRLTPYLTATPQPSRTNRPGSSPAGSPTPFPSLTPTPRSYTVVRGDDMFGIALRHGIELEVLLTANPTIDPAFLSVGTELKIPASVATPDPAQSTPTPVPAEVRPPDCYPVADGGLWCFLLVANPHAEALENLSAQLLVSGYPDGQIASQTAFPPLNVLSPGSAMPLAAYFPPPVPEDFQPHGQLLTALLLPAEDPRYAPAVVDELEIEIADGSFQAGRLAHVSGSVRLEAGSQSLRLLWVAAVAYDAAGRVVGLRKWDAGLDPAGGENSPERLPFELTVYSLGPAIDRVELLVEAQRES